MKTVVTAAVLLLMAAGAFAVSIRSFQEKGFLFNNAYLYASEQERSAMDKKPYYRQSAVVFFLAGLTLLLCAAEVVSGSRRIFYSELAVAAAAVIYAVISSIRIRTKKKSEQRKWK